VTAGNGNSAMVLERILAVAPDPTTLTYLGARTGSAGTLLAVVASLTVERTGRPPPSHPVTFTLGGKTVTATTDSNGAVATTTLRLPSAAGTSMLGTC
jgi:hypothetical protein